MCTLGTSTIQMIVRLKFEFSVPEIRGGGVPEVPCRAREVKKPLFGSVRWRLINGGSFCLDPEKHILECPSPSLTQICPIFIFSSPKIGRVGTGIGLLGSWGEKTHLRHRWRRWINRNSVGVDPEKRILGCSTAWLMENRLIIEISRRKIGGGGT